MKLIFFTPIPDNLLTQVHIIQYIPFINYIAMSYNAIFLRNFGPIILKLKSYLCNLMPKMFIKF